MSDGNFPFTVHAQFIHSIHHSLTRQTITAHCPPCFGPRYGMVTVNTMTLSHVGNCINYGTGGPNIELIFTSTVPVPRSVLQFQFWSVLAVLSFLSFRSHPNHLSSPCPTATVCFLLFSSIFPHRSVGT